MNLSSTSKSSKSFTRVLAGLKPRPGMAFGIIILVALIAFEIFNYATTDYALRDLLGELSFAGIHWATILALAFCSIDFAGIARLFAPAQAEQEPKEIWYMFGAWLLAATMNAMLTWWGVSMAITNHAVVSQAIVDSHTIFTVIPVFVALMVWVIRILLIGSLSTASERMFSSGNISSRNSSRLPARGVISNSVAASQNLSGASLSSNAVPRAGYSRDRNAPRPEPTYHSLNARPAGRQSSAKNETNSSAYHL